MQFIDKRGVYIYIYAYVTNINLRRWRNLALCWFIDIERFCTSSDRNPIMAELAVLHENVGSIAQFRDPGSKETPEKIRKIDVT